MKYRKKPIEVEAYFVGSREDWVNGPLWLREYSDDCGNYEFRLELNTMDEAAWVSFPVWVVRECDGVGCYPVSVQKFGVLYEEIV